MYSIIQFNVHCVDDAGSFSQWMQAQSAELVRRKSVMITKYMKQLQWTSLSLSLYSINVVAFSQCIQMSVNVELEATCIKCDNGNDNDTTEWNETQSHTANERVRLRQKDAIK